MLDYQVFPFRNKEERTKKDYKNVQPREAQTADLGGRQYD